MRKQTPLIPILSGIVISAILLPQSNPAPADEGGRRPPNVIIVVTDDQGYGDLGVHGHPYLKTPHLDTLHRESVRLTDFHVMPLCAPTRAALMTGRNPLRDGIWATVLGRSILPERTPTIADVFKAGGYRTAMIGKWHLGDNAPARPQDKGFDHVFMHGGGGVGQTPDHWGNDYQNDVYSLNGEPIRTTGYCTDVWFAAAGQFVKENKDRPFFLYLATNAPHAPYVPPPETAAQYEAIPGIDVRSAAFYAMIANIDSNIGMLRQEIRAHGLDRNTIFVFMTDNGTAQGTRAVGQFNAGMRGAKGSLYDGGHRVPCFVRWPEGGLGEPEGRDADMLSTAEDLLPTLAKWCGIDLTRHPVPIDGKDLSAAIHGDKPGELADRHLFVQFAQTDTPPVTGRAAVITPQWRLVNMQELYDIRADPGQSHDIATERPEVVRSLQAKYDAWFSSFEKARNSENPIQVGLAQEPVTRLNVMDLHTGGTPADLPWNQPMILEGRKVRGYWALEIRESGTYQVECRRWPEESGMKLSQSAGDAKSWPIAQARIRFGDEEWANDALPNDSAVRFEVPLTEGPVRLHADFLDTDGREIGSAFYVTIRRK